MTDSFEEFRQKLHSQVSHAEQLGVSRDNMVAGAQHIGDWLSREVDPRNPEQRLLRELWQVSDEDEQKAIASSLVKMAERGK